MRRIKSVVTSSISRLAVLATFLFLSAPLNATADVTLDRLYRMGDDPSEPASNGATINLSFDGIGTVFANGDLQDLTGEGDVFYSDISSDRPVPSDTTNNWAAQFSGNGRLFGEKFNSPSTTASNTNSGSPIQGNYDGLVDRGYQLWAKPASTGFGGFQNLVFDTVEHGVFINPDGLWGARYNNSLANSTISAQADAWTHLMQVRPAGPAGGSILYVNGVAAVAQSGGYNPGQTGALSIGGNQAGDGGFYHGLIDEIEMFVLGNNGIVDSKFNYATDNGYFTDVFLPSQSGYSLGDPWLVGDATFDGSVGQADVDAFIAGWLSSNAADVVGNGGPAGDLNTIQMGDFNLDGVVDRRDWFLLREAFITANGFAPSINLSQIPEPNSMSIILGVVTILAVVRMPRRSMVAACTVMASVVCLSAQAQLTITTLGQNDPSNVFLQNTEPLSSFTTIFEGDPTAGQGSLGRGQTFVTPSTGDTNNGWGVNALTLRWDEQGDRYPTDLQFRLSIYAWPSTDPEDFSTPIVGGQLPGNQVYSQVGSLPPLTPQVNLFDGDRLRFGLGQTVFMQENLAYGFLLEFDPNSGIKDNETLRLEITQASGVSPGVRWDTDLNLNTGQYVSSQGFASQDLVFYLEGSSMMGTAESPVLTINRDTGAMTLRNDTVNTYSIISYDILTSDGQFDQSGWATIESQGIATDTWFTFTDPASATDLAEGTLGELAITPGMQINFNKPGEALWRASPFEDLEMTLQDANGNAIPVAVGYEGNNGEPFAIGDFNTDGNIDALDWPFVRDNLLTDVSAEDAFTRYFSGDLNGDGVVDVNDFSAFKALFEAHNGPGSFQAMLAGVQVPEPGAGLLAIIAGMTLLGSRRFVRLPISVLHLTKENCSTATKVPINLYFRNSFMSFYVIRKSALTSICLLVSMTLLAAGANAEIIFHADFNAATPIDANTGLTNNASVSNLNSGTSVGSWSLAGAGNNPGAIISNPAGTDFGFAFDGVTSGGGNNRVQGLFSESVVIGGGDSLSFEFDIYPSRQGGVTENRQVRIALTDSGGTSSGSRAYVLLFNLQETDVAGANKGFKWLNTEDEQFDIAYAAGVGFRNPNVDNYQTWESGVGGRTGFPPEDDGKMIRAKLDILGQATVAGSSGAFLSIDWNNNGVFDIVEAPLGPRDINVNVIDRFELFYDNNSATSRGAYFDNIKATAQLGAALTLFVDENTGVVRIDGSQFGDVDIDFYQISSDAGLLKTSGWNSLQDQDIEGSGPPGDGMGWEEAGGSSSFALAEAFLQGSSTLLQGQTFATLGPVFDVTSGLDPREDLTFTYRQPDGAIVAGRVEVGTIGAIPGDFDGDGVVDGQDFLAWQRNPSLGNLADWEANFGSGAPLSAAVNVPEPSAALLLCIGVGLAITGRRSITKC